MLPESRKQFVLTERIVNHARDDPPPALSLVCFTRRRALELRRIGTLIGTQGRTEPRLYLINRQ
jgi:hypothetical protein